MKKRAKMRSRRRAEDGLMGLWSLGTEFYLAMALGEYG